jgi:hypothetical protein
VLRKLLPVLILVISMVICSSANAAQTQEYNVVFQGINGSGVSGEGFITFDGDKLRTDIQASGLEAGQTHGIHIHGTEGQDLKCPANSNNDGYMSHDEVHTNFGAHALDLTPYPKADTNGNISLDQDYTENLDKLAPLEEKVILIHGATVDGRYDGDVAVACGEIMSASIASSSSLPSSGGVSITLLLSSAIALIFLALPALVLLVRRSNYLNRT